MYNYYMEQIPTSLRLRRGEEMDKIAAAFLQDMTNQYAAQGWEFYRVDEIGVYKPQGCIATLFGLGPRYQRYCVITFRKLKTSQV